MPRRMPDFRRIALWLLLVVASVAPRTAAVAQESTDAAGTDEPRNHPFYVFIQPDAAATSAQQLIFLDGLTGEQQVLEVTGERFSIHGRAVLYFDTARRQVMQAAPGLAEATLTEHPLLQLPTDALRIDWMTSADDNQLAWSVTRSDAPGELTTLTYVAVAEADSDGTNPRQVFTDTRRDGLRAMPVAFDPTGARLYMDYQPDGISALTAYPQYAGLFALDLKPESPGVWQFLEGEPGDFTGAGFGGAWVLRLSLAADFSGFDLNVMNVETGQRSVIPAVEQRMAFSQAGDVLISPDGAKAVYALSQITRFGTPEQTLQTVFMLVDLKSMTQRSLIEITTFVRAVSWTEDNSAIILTSPQQPGTWKIGLTDARLEKIAESTYLGLLN